MVILRFGVFYLVSYVVYLISLLCAAMLMPKAQLLLVYHPGAPVGVR